MKLLKQRFTQWHNRRHALSATSGRRGEKAERNFCLCYFVRILGLNMETAHEMRLPIKHEKRSEYCALCWCLVVRFMKAYTLVVLHLACGEARARECIRGDTRPREQRSHWPNGAQPFGRQFFFGQTSLLAPHRPLTGMLVARASSGRKIPCRECIGFHETDY